MSLRQLDRYPPRSPERAFLRWYRAIQEPNNPVAAEHYVDSLHISARDAEFNRYTANPTISTLGPPRILDVVREGDTATIYTMLPRERFAPNGRVDVYRRPFAFHLKRVEEVATPGDRLAHPPWKLTDNLFIKIAGEQARKALKERGL